MVWVHIPLEATLFFAEIFKILRCQFCTEMPDLCCKRKSRFSNNDVTSSGILSRNIWFVNTLICLLSYWDTEYSSPRLPRAPRRVPTSGNTSTTDMSKTETREHEEKTLVTRSESLLFLDIICKLIVLSQYFPSSQNDETISQIYTSDKEQCKFLSINIVVNFYF